MAVHSSVERDRSLTSNIWGATQATGWAWFDNPDSENRRCGCASHHDRRLARNLIRFSQFWSQNYLFILDALFVEHSRLMVNYFENIY